MTAPLTALEGKYEILEKIREGGMGAIYRVRHRLLDEQRVVKIMRPQLADDDEFAERFVREARAASRLRHANIAQIYDFTIGEDGSASIVMEYIDGIDLGQVVRRRPLPSIRAVLTIASQALTALEVLHQRGFVHRDISPDNLMATRGPAGELTVKLIDLGIAKALDREHGLTSTGEFLGKIQYASPEHFGGPDGRHTVEPRSDLYSLGVVLFELLTGHKPYSGQDFSSISSAHLYHPPLDFTEVGAAERVPEDLQVAVLVALSKDPADRYPSAGAFRDALDAILARWPTATSPVATAEEIISERPPAPPEVPQGDTQARLDQAFPPVETPTGVRDDAHSGPTEILSRERPFLNDETPVPPPTPRPSTPHSPEVSAPPPGRTALAASAGAAALVVVGLLGLWAWARQPSRPAVPTAAPVLTHDVAAPPGDTGSPELSPGLTPPTGGQSPVASPDSTAADELVASEEVQAQDQERLLAMTETYAELVRLGSSTQGTAQDRITAWQRFLELYGGNLLSTTSDDRIRDQAREHLAYWESRADRAPTLLADTGVPDDNATTSPEEVMASPLPSEPAGPPARDPGLPDGRPAIVQGHPPGSIAPSSVPEPEVPISPSTRNEAREALAHAGVPLTQESLQTATRGGERETVRLLLLGGVETAGRFGSRTLVAAIETHAFEIADDLIAAGAVLRGPTSVLDAAAGRGDLGATRFLVERSLGNTDEGLEEALDQRQLAVARYLVEVTDSSLADVSDEAERFLVRAAEQGNQIAVEWLLAAGVETRKGAGRKAIAKARDAGYPDIAALIEAARRGG